MAGKKNKKPTQSKKEEKEVQPQKKQDNTKSIEKQAEINKILEAVNGMDLDNPDFIDIKSFDEGKQILVNAIDDLSSYIALYKKGDYSKFPAPANTQKVEAK